IKGLFFSYSIPFFFILTAKLSYFSKLCKEFVLFYYIFRIFARRFAEIIVHTLAQTDDFLGTGTAGFSDH
ncbi:MAG: hypothetical protein MST01_02450, partial [Prevotella sp.]|nr:hypothetical protein [Prevotella sp.]